MIVSVQLAGLLAFSVVPLAWASPHSLVGTAFYRRDGGHRFTIRNNCPDKVHPKIIDTKCGFSPRTSSHVQISDNHVTDSRREHAGCADAASFSGPQPRELQGHGDSLDVTINNNVCIPRHELC
jgi:hypothetical protein